MTTSASVKASMPLATAWPLIWTQLQNLGTRQDVERIRGYIRAADVEPGMYARAPASSFKGNPTRTTQWLLGQLAAIIDQGSDFAVSDFVLRVEHLVRDGKTLPVAQTGPGSVRSGLAP